MLVFLVDLYFVLTCHFLPHYMSEISQHLTVARIEFMVASKIMLQTKHNNTNKHTTNTATLNITATLVARIHSFVISLSFRIFWREGIYVLLCRSSTRSSRHPLKPAAQRSSQRHLLSAEGKSSIASSHLGGGETEGSSTVIAQGDIPAQFTRVMGKGSYVVLPVI